MTRILVLGGTGMVGQAVARDSRDRKLDTVCAARSGGDVQLDLTDDDALRKLVRDVRPDVTINAAANVDHAAIEGSPGPAYLINARFVGVLAEAVREATGRLVHISTDQWWTGDGNAQHDEDAPVRILNEYARSKLAGEAFALTAPDALVVRTNVTGLRGTPGRPTFVEWVFETLDGDEPLRLFDDFFTSTMAATDLARALLDLAGTDQRGIINVASSQVSSKLEFVGAIARAQGRPLREHEVASVRDLWPPRAESLGLDVRRAEHLLGRLLPDLGQTAEVLVAAHARP